MSTEPREAMRDMDGSSARAVGPVTGALLLCASAVLVITVAWLLWTSGVFGGL